MNGLDLFSGIGGLTLALAPWVKPVAYCEIEPYARSVLLSRMRDGTLPLAPIWDDVRTLRASDLGSRNPVDIVYGGFPCQDISVAGRRAGLEGKRSGLYREVIRLVDELRPRFVFLENVSAIRAHAWRVVEDLARLGFDCRWTALFAAEVGAPHRRDRWWLLAANPRSFELREQSGGSGGSHRQSTSVTARDGSEGAVAAVGDSDSQGQLQQSGIIKPQRGWSGHASGEVFTPEWWATEPDVGRVAHGVPARVDRLRGLGNAVVPAQARRAFEILSGLRGAQ